MARRQLGFTLIELMIVVAIIAILASIAYPSYQDSIRRTWRGKATACLVSLSQSMERRFTANFNYNGAAVPADGCVTEDGMATRYGFSFVAAPGATYTLQAVPTGGQATDACGTLTINQAGTRGAGGPGADECW